MSASESLTKGNVIRRVLEFVEERFGKEAREELASDEVVEATGLPLKCVMPGAWYPTAGFIRLLEITSERCFEGDPEHCFEIGRYALERDLNTVYRAFLMFVSTDFLLKMAPKLWRQYHNTGELKVLEKSPRHAVFAIDRYSHPSVHEWYVAVGGSLRALECAGAKDVRYEIQTGLRSSDGRLVYRFDWS